MFTVDETAFVPSISETENCTVLAPELGRVTDNCFSLALPIPRATPSIDTSTFSCELELADHEIVAVLPATGDAGDTVTLDMVADVWNCSS
jgi:hypothetical protein